MNQYFGTKHIAAKPMTRGQYNDFRGWKLPADENGHDDGYLVEYLDGGKPNVAGHAGYVSWSPMEQFEAAYQATDALSFGHALVALKAGHRVARAGWNGKGMWLKIVPTELAEAVAFQHAALDALPWIGMKTADDKFVPWLASQTDVLADDWQIVA